MTARVVLALLLVAVAFSLITLVALEGSEVVVLRTVDAHAAARDTRTWVADEDGHAWIEAATAERPFLRDLQARPEVELVRQSSVLRCRATPAPNPEGLDRPPARRRSRQFFC